MWAFQEVFPVFRRRDREGICRKLSKLVEEHGEKIAVALESSMARELGLRNVLRTGSAFLSQQLVCFSGCVQRNQTLCACK